MVTNFSAKRIIFTRRVATDMVIPRVKLLVSLFFQGKQIHLVIQFVIITLADQDMVCAGRVTAEDMKRTLAAVGGSVLTTVSGKSFPR